eukprot:CAMPEP_0184312516 /NCGR_PEP_ID=MMETSP1049-20130417/50638_1 /TAXON_ID=77928 /ORGANISM="Proteomonas sulcata, Strain CCMP704" /LENGTH=64 /DNA_ID=CAMNT_0026628739 /DNA_START=162 /DNA_END=353 /DNA_ORIENTATION=-
MRLAQEDLGPVSESILILLDGLALCVSYWVVQKVQPDNSAPPHNRNQPLSSLGVDVVVSQVQVR